VVNQAAAGAVPARAEKVDGLVDGAENPADLASQGVVQEVKAGGLAAVGVAIPASQGVVQVRTMFRLVANDEL
jgi:hypothetical protein